MPCAAPTAPISLAVAGIAAARPTTRVSTRKRSPRAVSLCHLTQGLRASEAQRSRPESSCPLFPSLRRKKGAASYTRRVSRAQRLTLVATILGSTVVFLDSTVVNVALPAIADGLDAGLAGQQWVVEAYMLTLVSLLLVGGSLGDQFGRRRMFV